MMRSLSQLASMALLLLCSCGLFGPDPHRHLCDAHPEPPFPIPQPPRCSVCDRGHDHQVDGAMAAMDVVTEDASKGGDLGVGIVFATADFDDRGSVLIKFQINAPGELPLDAWTGKASFTAWVGDGAKAPRPDALPKTRRALFHEPLPRRLPQWTAHLTRSYDQKVDDFKMVVEVRFLMDDGSFETRIFANSWKPSEAPRPARIEDFNEA